MIEQEKQPQQEQQEQQKQQEFTRQDITTKAIEDESKYNNNIIMT